MVQAGRIALQSTHHKFGDGENVGEMLDDGEERDADEAREEPADRGAEALQTLHTAGALCLRHPPDPSCPGAT